MDKRCVEKLELDKILKAASEYAALGGGKACLLSRKPFSDPAEVKNLLKLTEECDLLLYRYGIGKTEYFDDCGELLTRAEKGSRLSCGELLSINALMRSARRSFESIDKISDENITLMRSFTNRLYFDRALEDDIGAKIISQDEVGDYASDKLYSIRSKIKSLNEKIRTKLGEYLSKDAKYLQDGIVTIRNDRYVIPVKAEYKSSVRGFVHDRSHTGATFFIEPEYVLELNNELIALTLDEKEEVDNILKELSVRVGKISQSLKEDTEVLYNIDACFAAAEYAYALKAQKPKINSKGYINIIKGRHPLIDKDKTVPVSVTLGGGYDFLLLSGANTGGKTVTLKMCGLFCLMACCGLFIPAAEGSEVAAFESVFCDIGDSQSIEENLSTFSSHLTNIINIVNDADGKSLVLIDELGGGTNPDEGQALAKAILKHLKNKGCKGIITTHFTSLKEYAYGAEGIENASMEFDSDTLKPLYKIKIGLAGASNALAISKRLGLDEDVLNDAYSFLSDGAKSFENVLKKAEESRIQAEEKLSEAIRLEREWKAKLQTLNSRIDEINKEKEKIAKSARTESRRIVAERTERAEEILNEIEEIFKSEELTQSDLIRARTLKNKIKEVAYDEQENKNQVNSFKNADKDNLNCGMTVYVKPLQCTGRVTAFNRVKGEAEIQCGNMKLHLKCEDLLIAGEKEKEQKKVKVIRNIPFNKPVLEINVLGMTVEEALYEVDNFIDSAVTQNLEEIKVIHGVGTGRLKSAIAERLKRHKNVESFRSGKYGEGETGVTFIKLK